MANHNGDQMAAGAPAKKPVEEEPFPTRQLIVLAICRFAEPIAFNSILAYTYVMTRDLLGEDNPDVSFYAGLLVSAFPVAEALTAVLWGAISDRVGRKPIALFGLMGVAVSCLIFGLAKSYWVAFLARFIGGALNGNVAVMQTMVAEMVKNPAHEPVAYAVQPFVWILGSILGSAMGGYLAQPSIFYPSIFPEDGLFGQYPYLLPNIVSVAAILLAVVQGMILLEETNPGCIKGGHTDVGESAVCDDEAEDDEGAPLLRSASHPRSAVESISEVAGPVFLEEGLPTSTDQRFDLRRSSFGTMHSIRLPNGQGGADASQDPRAQFKPSNGEEEAPANEKTFTRPVIILTLTLVIIAYHQMAFGAVLPIQLIDVPSTESSPGIPSLDLFGGFGLTVHDVGTFMAVSGILALIIQGVVFPLFVERVGVWHSFLICVILYPIPYALMPFLTLLVGIDPPWLLNLGIYALMMMQSFFGIISGPCILIFLKNAAPSPRVLGKVNGFAMSATCAARTIGPPLVGMVYDKGGSAAAWLSCAGVAVLGCIQLFWVPRDLTGIDKVNVESAFKMPEILVEEAHTPAPEQD
ncbi:MFS general substrate transporter [Thozetella sp. PMI_491]|nr:MFS general substrate transporter [Thozetella sp. PMI_491]